MSKFVAYYRVSTDKQGRFGLGMEAQREAVTRSLVARGQLAGEFIEVESGKKHTNRPQLTVALGECRKHRAVLVIAKLDRLARNVHFISGPMNSDVEFVAVDMPTANRLTIHILAAVAEHEREMISQRTKGRACPGQGTRHQARKPASGRGRSHRTRSEETAEAGAGGFRPGGETAREREGATRHCTRAKPPEHSHPVGVSVAPVDGAQSAFATSPVAKDSVSAG